MDKLSSDLIKLLIEYYFGPIDTLALFCTSKKFSVYSVIYREILLDAKKGWSHCIISGKLMACKFIHRRFGNIIDYHDFGTSCLKGYLELAQWLLHSAIKRPINIHKDDDYIFRYSCEAGQLEIVKWLIHYSVSINSPINIHSRWDHAFRSGCERGHLELVQWLVQYSKSINSPIDIHVYNNSAFNISCKNGHSKLAQWLMSN